MTSQNPAIVPRRGDRMIAACFVAPVVVLLATFVAWPFLNTARLAFYDVDRRGRIGRFVGWEHVTAVLGSHQLRSSIAATAAFVALTVPAGVLLALALAVLAHRPMRGIAAFRVIFSSTVVTSGALSAGLFITLFAPTTGAVRYALQSVHLLAPNATINLLNDNRWAIVAVAAVTVWANLGLGFILFSAALQGVPEVLYEAARLDGCGRFALFRRITVPGIRPMIGFTAIAMSLNAILSFGQIDLLTKGGPGGRTDVLAYALYRKAFRDNDQSKASVMAMVLIILCLVLGAAQVRFLRGRGDERTI
jgi:sn-glycerol 3-phosphate transport system permease protein